MTWYGGDLVEEEIGSEAGRQVLGMSSVSLGFRQGLHRMTETRRLESRPGMSDGRSR